MNAPKRPKQDYETSSILDLPTELIEQICSYNVIKLVDIFNLAISHSKLNNCIFREKNSYLWKFKYLQKYGPLDNDEYKISINEQNSWKDEIMMRVNINRAVYSEILQMPSKFLKFKDIPYHLYPLSEYLHSKNQAHRYYVFSATSALYRRLINSYRDNENYLAFYMTQLFLIYSSRVCFGYILKDFLSLHPTEQTLERGFYLLGCWWDEKNETPYHLISTYLDKFAVYVSKSMFSKNQSHPFFESKNYIDLLIQRGKTNLNFDLFNENNTMCILECIKNVLFDEGLIMMCSCIQNFDCFLLHQAIRKKNLSVFLLCVFYESIARRLGVKVKITATSTHNFISWSSSWPGNIHKNPTSYVIDIAGNGVIRKATRCPVSNKLPEHFVGNSIPNLFWTYSKTLERIAHIKESKFMVKNVLYLQKLINPNEHNLDIIRSKFHTRFNFCECPLLRDSLNPNAPNHDKEINFKYSNCSDIFPLVPRTRGTGNDPKYSIGMMIETICKKRNLVSNRVVIVGWKKNPSDSKSSDSIIYYVISIDDCLNKLINYQNPELIILMEDNNHVNLVRRMNAESYLGHNIGKFFKHFDRKVCAFVPIDDLTKLYPDDLSYTFSQSLNNGNK